MVYVQLPLFTIQGELDIWHGEAIYVETCHFWNGYTQVLYFLYL